MSALKASNGYPYNQEDVNRYIATKGDNYQHFLCGGPEQIQEFKQMNVKQDEQKLLLNESDGDYGQQENTQSKKPNESQCKPQCMYPTPISNSGKSLCVSFHYYHKLQLQ